MDTMTLCGANSTAMKYYFNYEDFGMLPESVQEELRALCVLFTAEVGGILYLEFDPEGELLIRVTHADDDFLFDEIGAALKAKALRSEHRELFEQLEMFWKMIILPKKTGEAAASAPECGAPEDGSGESGDPA